MSQLMPIAGYPHDIPQTLPNIVRPIANFHPNVWGDHFLNITTGHQEVVTLRRREHESLKHVVRRVLLETVDYPMETLELIDTIERLGVAYHFEKEIEEFLGKVYDAYRENATHESNLSLYHTSLRFRVLRQHGRYISSDDFAKFTDDQGDFLEALSNDAKGLLSLYDAAHLRGHGEGILEKAIEFTTIHLKAIAGQKSHPLGQQIARALVYPNHRGMIQIESREYMSHYEQDPTHLKPLMRFAKLEAHLQRSIHKKELQELTGWWRSFNFSETFPFIRDRVVEAYLFSIAIFYHPKFSTARVVYTKVFLLLTIMDDIYDSYGTIEELEAFTNAIWRWDKESIDDLPDYMKRFYVIQYDTYKEFEHEFTKLGIENNVHYAVKEVMTQSEFYLQEARWLKMKYVPTFDEYFENAVKSIAITVTVVVSLLFHDVEEDVAKMAIESVSRYCKPHKATCIIGRFGDDLADHKWDKHRDHIPGGIDCYVKQYRVTEDEAYAAIENMTEDAWKDINEEIYRPITPVPRPLLAYMYNFCRAMDYVYKNENGYTIVSKRMKDTIKLLFVEPIPI